MNNDNFTALMGTISILLVLFWCLIVAGVL